MYEIDNEFTLDFITQKLNSDFHPERPNYTAYIMADFLQQRGNAEYEDGHMDDVFYNHVIEIAQAYLDSASEPLQRNVALNNLYGTITHHKEQHETLRFIKEQGKYLTVFEKDSHGQINAKKFITDNMVVVKKPSNG
jgi:uncharacterized protein (DUF2164 family)